MKRSLLVEPVTGPKVACQPSSSSRFCPNHRAVLRPVRFADSVIRILHYRLQADQLFSPRKSLRPIVSARRQMIRGESNSVLEAAITSLIKIENAKWLVLFANLLRLQKVLSSSRLRVWTPEGRRLQLETGAGLRRQNQNPRGSLKRLRLANERRQNCQTNFKHLIGQAACKFTEASLQAV